MYSSSFTHHFSFEGRNLTQLLGYQSLVECAAGARLTDFLSLRAYLLHQWSQALAATFTDRLHLSLLRIGQIKIAEHRSCPARTASSFKSAAIGVALPFFAGTLRLRDPDGNSYRKRDSRRQSDCVNSVYFAHVTSQLINIVLILSKVPFDKTPSEAKWLPVGITKSLWRRATTGTRKLSNCDRRTISGKSMYRIYKISFAAMLTIIGATIDSWADSLPVKRTSVSQVSRANADLLSAVKKNKESMQALIPHHEATLNSTKAALESRKRLFEQGLASKLEVDSAEQAVKDAEAQLELTRKQLVETDQLFAEASAESVKPSSPGGLGRYTTTAAVMRYSGAGGWVLSQASKVKDFFTSTFGRQLPISALGQSPTHNRLRFDHRNSVDVALHPDSAEGKALIEYLRVNGVPFLAFRSAIPGVATGAHIHIGYPSHRMGS